MPAPKKNSSTRMGRLVPRRLVPLDLVSAKKDAAAARRNQAAKGESAGVVAKNAARSAKRPGSASAPSRPGVNTSAYNTAFVAAKKDIAAFKRGQAKKKK